MFHLPARSPSTKTDARSPVPATTVSFSTPSAPHGLGPCCREPATSGLPSSPRDLHHCAVVPNPLHPTLAVRVPTSAGQWRCHRCQATCGRLLHRGHVENLQAKAHAADHLANDTRALGLAAWEPTADRRRVSWLPRRRVGARARAGGAPLRSVEEVVWRAKHQRA